MIIILINIIILIILILIMITTVQVYAGNSKGRSDTLVIAENILLREDTTKVTMIIYGHLCNNSIIILFHNHLWWHKYISNRRPSYHLTWYWQSPCTWSLGELRLVSQPTAPDLSVVHGAPDKPTCNQHLWIPPAIYFFLELQLVSEPAVPGLPSINQHLSSHKS